MKIKRFVIAVSLGLGLTLILLALMNMTPASAAPAAQTYHVKASSGSDATGDGSAGNPWKTISHAANKVSAGTSISRQIIVVAAGTYDGALGEIFPIVFENEYVRLAGSGAATTIIDGGGITDVISVTVEGITIQDFTIQNAIGDGIESSMGGLTVRDNVFRSVDTGFRLFTDPNLPGVGTYTTTGVLVTGNTFSVTSSGINVDTHSDAGDTASTIGFGGLEVLSNTFYMTDTTASGVEIENYSAEHLDGGQVNFGDVTISANVFVSGSYGINMNCDDHSDYLTDTLYTVGNLTITDNDFWGQDSRAVYVDCHTADHWYGTTSVTYGDLLISGNDIASGESSVYGIRVYEYPWWEYLYDDVSATVGQVSIADNTIDVTSYGVHFYYGYIDELYDNAAVSLEATRIVSNEIDAGSDGVYMYYSDVGEDMNNFSTLSIGDLYIDDNVITATSEGVYAYYYCSGYGVYNSAAITVGNAYIRRNEIVADSEGIYLGNDAFAYTTEDDAVVTVGDQYIEHNQISNTGGNAGIYIYNYESGYDMSGHSRLSMGNQYVANNAISSTSRGIYVYDRYIGADVYSDTVTTWGQMHITSNTIRAISGEGIYVKFNYVADEVYDNAQVIVGDFDITANQFLGGSDGVELEYNADHVNRDIDPTAHVELPDYALVNNVMAGNVSGLYVNANAPVDVIHNTIASPTVGSGAGIYVLTGTVRVTNTIVASYTTGISITGGTVSEDYNLFYGATDDMAGAVASGGHSLSGDDPAFVNPAGDDYHISDTSAAQDAGVNAGVTVDIEGNPRPRLGGYDIGAYEYEYPARLIFLPLVLRQHP